MITERDGERPRSERFRLAWALVFSTTFNLVAWLLATGHFSLVRNRAVPPSEREFIVSSTALRVERRPVPQPRHPATHAARAAQPRTATISAKNDAPRRPARIPRELARIDARAASRAPATSSPEDRMDLARALDEQQKRFAREVAQLRAENDPLSIATTAPKPPAAFHRSAFDASGSEHQGVEAVLTPVQHWYDGGRSCYYVRYTAQFSGGAAESGTIPWPVCYPRDADRMLPLTQIHVLPVPAPQPDYVLPPGTYLTPLLRTIYTVRHGPSRA